MQKKLDYDIWGMKAIADYVGKDRRTILSWEKAGFIKLYRPMGKQSVCAYKKDLPRTKLK